jgi:hypothetical protein
MWKLRRLAPRAVRVLERRKSEAPVLAAYEPKLLPVAERFIAGYDRAAGYRSTWLRKMQEGREATAILATTVHSWLPLVADDISALNNSEFAPSPVADDVITSAQRLLDAASEYVDAQGNPLAYREALIADVSAKLETGVEKRAEAEAADRAYQQTMAEARRTAAAFDVALQAFRKSLSRLLGRNDKDFQKLRVQRAAQRDEEDDPGAPMPDPSDTPE